MNYLLSSNFSVCNSEWGKKESNQVRPGSRVEILRSKTLLIKARKDVESLQRQISFDGNCLEQSKTT